MYVKEILGDLIRRNPGENEFHQAASEVLEALAPVVESDPKYRKMGILERITEPAR